MSNKDRIRHIYLTGFMGSGKSTIGKKLSKTMELPFIDLDDYIEKKEETTVREIFKSKGESYFRKAEYSALCNLAEMPTHVIALGGGTMCQPKCAEKILQTGVSVYIKLSAAALYNRLKNAKSVRPLLSGMDNESLRLYIESKLKERELFYNKAHIHVDGHDLKGEGLGELMTIIRAELA